jgi:hypothetical protein
MCSFRSVLFLCFLLAFSCSHERKKTQVQAIVESLSNYEKGILDLFFRTLFLETSSGFCIYGEKPLTVWGITRPSIHFGLADELACISAILNEGFRICERSGLSRIKSRYRIYASDKEQNGWIDFFCMNERVFVNVIQKNIVLFQYVLGPRIDSDSLLKMFLNPNENLHSLLHDNQVLHGIVLGYGTQNALVGGRAEVVQGNLENRKIEKIEPSFGFSNLEQEFAFLQNKMKITTNLNDPLPRLPWFGYVENKESSQILASYQTTQKTLKMALASSNFLGEVLSQIFDEPISLEIRTSFMPLLFDKLKKITHLSYYLGQAMYESLKKNNELEYLEFFKNGIIASEKSEGNSCSLDNLRCDFKEYVSAKEKDQALGQQVAFQFGQKIWDRFKQLDFLSLAQVLEGMQNVPLSQEQWEIINQLDMAAWLVNKDDIPNVIQKLVLAALAS